MDDLLAEINRKRSYVESKPGVMVKEKKFFKRSDLMEAEKNEYLSKTARKGNESSNNSTEVSADESIDQLAEKSSEKNQLPNQEVLSRLRKRGQPIKLFGESELMTYQRLRKLELVDPAGEEMEGLKNDMKLMMDRMEQETAVTLARDSSSQDTYNVKTKKSAGITFDELAQKALELNRHDLQYDANVVLKFCQLMLENWGEELNGRPLEVKKSQQGRLETARYMQTVDYLKPMMRKLKSVTLEEEVLDSLTSIIYWTLQKEYVKANDCYLQMAIGNAPWPIGVTMHGIHARPGKDKLATKTIAHVLNDEMQRKYIQAAKRLITFCQKTYPTCPSKSVEFNA